MWEMRIIYAKQNDLRTGFTRMWKIRTTNTKWYRGIHRDFVRKAKYK